MSVHSFAGIREAVGRGGIASLPCPIINAPNRNKAGIPSFKRQDRPIEIVSLYVPFWLVCTEDRAQRFPVARNMSQNCFQVRTANFKKPGGAYFLSENWFYEKLILKTVIQKSEPK